MCDNTNQNLNKNLSESDLQDSLKNNLLYKNMLKEAIKTKKLNEFVETVWKDPNKRPKALLFCGCYQPIPRLG